MKFFNPQSLFSKTPVEIPNRSGFDCSHENLFTTKCGTLTPALVDELLPGDIVDLSAIANVQLPPMASDFYGHIDFKLEAFFVPFRLIYGGWQQFVANGLFGSSPTGAFSQVATTAGSPPTAVDSTRSILIPQLGYTLNHTTTSSTIAYDDFGPGTLSDYLGFKISKPGASDTNGRSIRINALPFLAYHKIWEDWYRDSRLQVPAFVRPDSTVGTTNQYPMYAPFIAPVGTITPPTYNNPSSSFLLNDFHPLWVLRQRNFGKDYFTTATPRPQAGDAASLALTVSNNATSFTIASLRAANSLQMWLERNNIAGFRYGDLINAHFGVYPSDAAIDRCLYLGRVNIPVYAKSVYQSAGDSTSTNNPVAGVGATFGSPQGVDSGKFFDDFKAKEHGFLFVMASLVPKAFYSTGTHRRFFRNSIDDFAWPLLQGVGDQPVYVLELTNEVGVDNNNPGYYFGYSQRYAEYKFMLDEVHGLLRDGESLESFALQRSFSRYGTSFSRPVIGTSFLQIPTTFLDQVSAVGTQQSSFGCWADVYFNYKKISTLAAYSIPTLGDLKNTHTEIIPTGGQRL